MSGYHHNVPSNTVLDDMGTSNRLVSTPITSNFSSTDGLFRALEYIIFDEHYMA